MRGGIHACWWGCCNDHLLVVRAPIQHKRYQLQSGEYINYIDIINPEASHPHPITFVMTHGFGAGLALFFGRLPSSLWRLINSFILQQTTMTSPLNLLEWSRLIGLEWAEAQDHPLVQNLMKGIRVVVLIFLLIRQWFAPDFPLLPLTSQGIHLWIEAYILCPHGSLIGWIPHWSFPQEVSWLRSILFPSLIYFVTSLRD